MPGPDFIRRTLVGRSIFDVEVSLHNQREREYLSNLDFLKGAAEQRDAQIKKSQAVQAVTAAITLYTLFVTVDTSIDLEIFALKIKNVRLLPEFLLVMIAVGTFYSITYVLNAVLATRMIQTVFVGSGLKHYRYFLADKSISDLWSSVLEYKTDGYASGRFHLLLLLGAVGIMIVGSIALPIASLFVVIRFGCQFIATSGLFSSSGLISALSMLIGSTSVLYFIVFLFVPLKFKFRELPRAASEAGAPGAADGKE